MSIYDKALEYCILTAQIRFKKLGASDDETKAAIKDAKNVAKKLDKEGDLPEWMKEIN